MVNMCVIYMEAAGGSMLGVFLKSLHLIFESGSIPGPGYP